MNYTLMDVSKFYDDIDGIKKIALEGSVDKSLMDLNLAVKILNDNWHGSDATVRIKTVIIIHNKIVFLRNKIADLVSILSRIAADYRLLQQVCDSKKTDFQLLNIEKLGKINHFENNADTIDINPNVIQAKNLIDTSVITIDDFINKMKILFSSLSDNWRSGPGRNKIVEIFDKYVNELSRNSELLKLVSSSVDRALRNYNML